MTGGAGPLYLAVDAGNTKTDALVVGEDGRVHGYGRAGRGDIWRDGEAAVRQVSLAVERALGHPPDPLGVAGVALRLAGIDWPEDAEFWRDIVRARWGSNVELSTLNDGYAGLRFGSADGVGVNVTVGTGSAIAARGRDGREWGLNEWGQHSLGAIGIGTGALRAIGLAELGMGPATGLTEVFAAHFGVDGAPGLIHGSRARGAFITELDLAAAAPLVTTAAAEGDPVACTIVERQAQLFASYTRMVASRVGFDAADEFPLVLSGSVVRGAEAPMRAALLDEFAKVLPAARPVLVDEPPVVGAALDVLAEAGVPITVGVRHELKLGFAAHLAGATPSAAAQGR